MDGNLAPEWNARSGMGANMRAMASVCIVWIAENGALVHRGIARVIKKGMEGGRLMVDLKILDSDIEAVRDRVSHYEIIASGFDDDHQRQREAWNKKSDLANRVLTYLLALRGINDIKEELCGNYCMYPEIWDADAEGCELAESKHCQNCPLNRL